MKCPGFAAKRRAFLRTVKAGQRVEVLTEVEVVVRLRTGLTIRKHTEKQYVGAIYVGRRQGGGHLVRITSTGVHETGMHVLSRDLFDNPA